VTANREIPAGQLFDLSTEVIGLERASGRALHIAPGHRGPPVRIEGYTVGAPFVTDDGPHGGERHPDGDELVYLVSGRIQVQLELDDGHRMVDVEPGQAIVIPQGVWHRIFTRQPGQIVHITPGPRGEHRPLPSSSSVEERARRA
jgi:mannose-6-phosphate isomerase-like protein (cupin superfamily)